MVKYGCENWTIKKAECRRLNAFELWCWRRLLRDPWTARRSNQSILKEISPGCSLATSCEELTHLKRPWCWERLRAGGEGDDREWNGWMASLTLLTWVWVDSGSWWWTGRPGLLWFMGSQRYGHDWATELNCKGSHQGKTERMAGNWNVIQRPKVLRLEFLSVTSMNKWHLTLLSIFHVPYTRLTDCTFNHLFTCKNRMTETPVHLWVKTNKEAAQGRSLSG